MRTFALDANCMVAAVCTWHEHHEAAVDEVERRLERHERLSVPAPALVEAYAVLTRLPAPNRLSGRDAWALLEANFVTGTSMTALDAVRYVDLLRHCPARGIVGGKTYDAVLGECARTGSVDTLLTFNTRHFDPPPTGVSIVEPQPSRRR